MDNTGTFGYDNGVEGVPLGNYCAFGYNITFVDKELRAIRNVLCRKHNACVLINKAHFSQTAYHYLAGSSVFVGYVNSAKFFKFEAAIILCHNGGIGCCVTCDTTGVERTERELRSRFTD